VDKRTRPQPDIGAWGLRPGASPAFPELHLRGDLRQRYFSTVSTAPSTSTKRKISLIETNTVENNPIKIVTQGHRIGGTDEVSM
jgi:hypothetical protein